MFTLTAKFSPYNMRAFYLENADANFAIDD